MYDNKFEIAFYEKKNAAASSWNIKTLKQYLLIIFKVITNSPDRLKG